MVFLTFGMHVSRVFMCLLFSVVTTKPALTHYTRWEVHDISRALRR